MARAMVRRWLGSGLWAVLDRGLFAVANFTLNVLLARWLAPTDYGAFTVAFTIFLLLGTLHGAVVTEPMLVFGSGKYRDRVVEYLEVLLVGHWTSGALAGSLLALGGLAVWSFGDGLLAPALVGFAVASPFVLYQWLMRLACYVNGVPRLAAQAGVLYTGLLAAGLSALTWTGILGTGTAPLVMAAASLASGAWIARRLGLRTAGRRTELGRAARADHARYGRWAVGTAGLGWISGNIIYLTLPLFAGLEAVAGLRAGVNLIMPALQGIGALGVVLLPELVRAHRGGGLFTAVAVMLAAFVAGAVVYGGALLGYTESIVSLLYGGRYANLNAVVGVLAVLPVFVAVVAVLGAALRAVERPRSVFVAYAWSTAMALTVGTWLVIVHGALGAAITMVLASLVTGTVLAYLLVRLRRQGAVAGSPSGATTP
jgi:O-antigen/teichoic acid export membrane protein